MSEFRSNLSSILRDKNISKRELSQKTGISEQSISRYTNGTRVPKITELIAIASTLNISTDKLLGVESKDDFKDISACDIIERLDILSNDTGLSVNESLDYHKAKIIVKKLYMNMLYKQKRRDKMESLTVRKNTDDILNLLNYKKIIIYIDDENKENYKEIMKGERINHINRISDYHDYYFVENCDINRIDVVEEMIDLLSDGYIIYNSSFQKDGMELELTPLYKLNIM